jgi:SAM-dependent methyltransferase
VASDEVWLDYGWSFVRTALPDPPAEVLEIGCGTLGGFVPALLRDGYRATGVDPEAPAGPQYRRDEFDSYDPPGPVDAVVASVSLHHVADLDLALDRMAAALRPGGTVVVIEWASEAFDEATARWCFSRLAAADPGPQHEHDHEHGPGWLQQHQAQWAASGLAWDAYIGGWLAEEGLHPGGKIIDALGARFARRSCASGPFFFADLAGTAEADEQAAIDGDQIRAGGIRYAGALR